jgi:hypothetical protein
MWTLVFTVLAMNVTSAGGVSSNTTSYQFQSEAACSAAVTTLTAEGPIRSAPGGITGYYKFISKCIHQ